MLQTLRLVNLRWGMGLAICAVIAWSSIFISEIIGTEILGLKKSPVSPIMLAILLGIIVGNTVNIAADIRGGISFAMIHILRLGIIFLGIRLGLSNFLSFGLLSIPLIILCMTVALVSTRIFAKMFAVSKTMSFLVATGTAICGATAIVAISPCIKARQEETAYAIANVTVFGILAMILYPYLVNFLFPDSLIARGLMLGTSVHETAQVAGAGLIYVQLFGNEQVLDIAVLTKLVRNSFMAFIIPFLAYRFNCTHIRTAMTLRAAFPIFILGFIGMSIFRTFGDWSLATSGKALWLVSSTSWTSFISIIQTSAEFCLIIAMSAVGLSTNVKQLRSMGISPFYIGLLAATMVGIASFIGITIMSRLGLL